MIKLVAYHMAWKRNIDSILMRGLLKSKSICFREKGGCVYFYKTRVTATSWGRVQLEVDITGLNITRPAEWELICWDDISPERIFGNKNIFKPVKKKVEKEESNLLF